eukprot:1161600-Pelagomonas_calceolata.AAC.1
MAKPVPGFVLKRACCHTVSRLPHGPSAMMYLISFTVPGALVHLLCIGLRTALAYNNCTYSNKEALLRWCVTQAAATVALTAAKLHCSDGASARILSSLHRKQPACIARVVCHPCVPHAGLIAAACPCSAFLAARVFVSWPTPWAWPLSYNECKGKRTGQSSSTEKIEESLARPEQQVCGSFRQCAEEIEGSLAQPGQRVVWFVLTDVLSLRQRLKGFHNEAGGPPPPLPPSWTLSMKESLGENRYFLMTSLNIAGGELAPSHT